MQSVTPLVSALVTTFNHETFIAHAIESLLDQTYPAVEIIVVERALQEKNLQDLKALPNILSVKQVVLS